MGGEAEKIAGIEQPLQSFESIHHLIKATKVRPVGDCSIENVICAPCCSPGEHFKSCKTARKKQQRWLKSNNVWCVKASLKKRRH